jgi:hypothetical protein
MKNLHNIFKKVSHGAGNVFKKASDVGEDVFKKTSGVVNKIKEQGPAIAKQISESAGQAENVLGKVSKISGKIASSPITQALPFGSTIASGAGMISQASRLGAKGAGQLSDVSDLSKYKKGGVRKQLENISDIQKRGQEIAKTGEELRSVFA